MPGEPESIDPEPAWLEVLGIEATGCVGRPMNDSRFVFKHHPKASEFQAPLPSPSGSFMEEAVFMSRQDCHEVTGLADNRTRNLLLAGLAHQPWQLLHSPLRSTPLRVRAGMSRV